MSEQLLDLPYPLPLQPQDEPQLTQSRVDPDQTAKDTAPRCFAETHLHQDPPFAQASSDAAPFGIAVHGNGKRELLQLRLRKNIEEANDALVTGHQWSNPPIHSLYNAMLDEQGFPPFELDVVVHCPSHSTGLSNQAQTLWQFPVGTFPRPTLPHAMSALVYRPQGIWEQVNYGSMGVSM